jgi:hypothetical protein
MVCVFRFRQHRLGCVRHVLSEFPGDAARHLHVGDDACELVDKRLELVVDEWTTG